MEQALYISSTNAFHYATSDFTRLYFGIEFCERLLPTVADMNDAAGFAIDRGMAFTCVTPFVTNRGLAVLEDLLERVARRYPSAEVVVNDWGVLQLVRSQFPDFKPVLGRLLNKSKRGPRIMNIIDQIPRETKDYFQGSNLDVPSAITFLRSHGIDRVEFDNLLQGVSLDATASEIHKSLYVPFAFVSATRFCLIANCNEPTKMDTIGVFPCGRECLKYRFDLYNPVMTLPLVRRGNAIFFVNENIPIFVSRQQVDRIVVQPEIPY